MSDLVVPAGIAIVRSGLLGAFPHVVFGLSTRTGGVSREAFGLNLSFRVGDDEPSVQANRERFFGSLGVPLDRLAVPTQIHSARVVRADRPGPYPECDGLVTDARNLYLAISIADCMPVFLYDPVREAAGAIHAGWRGSALGIVTKGLEALASEFGSRPGNIRAIIGQSAGACCYEVGEEVATEFPERFVIRRPGKKPHLDLHAYTVDLLQRFGLVQEHIELLTSCTICHPEAFHSYRRDGVRSGRMMGVLGLRERGPVV